MVKFGIVGCGMISEWHAEALLRIEGALLCGAADDCEQNLYKFTEKFHIRPYKSIENMLSCRDIDAVCICTPSGTHAQLAIQALQAGKHVVVEKPMAITVEQCDQVLAVCEKQGVKFSVISQLRFSEAILKVKRALEQKALGRIIYGDLYMKFSRTKEYYQTAGWRGTWRMDGGGALMNQGIHGIDLLLSIMGDVASVTAHARTLVHDIEVEDTAAALIEYKSGALGVIQSSTSVNPGFSRRIEINGSLGAITLTENTITGWAVPGETFVPEDKLQYNTADNPGAFGYDGHIAQLSDFVQAIETGRDPQVTGMQARKAVELISAMYNSSKTGQTVYLK